LSSLEVANLGTTLNAYRAELNALGVTLVIGSTATLIDVDQIEQQAQKNTMPCINLCTQKVLFKHLHLGSSQKLPKAKDAGFPPEALEAARLGAMGTYSAEDGSFNIDQYRANWHLPFMVVFGFIRRFNLRDFQIVGKDPVLSMIAAEIWHYNISRAIIAGVEQSELSTGDNAQRQENFGKCNTYSIAQYLGISPATCQRKVKKLVEIGWVHKDRKGQLFITKTCEDAFAAGANDETMTDFISTSRTLFRLLGLEISPAKRKDNFSQVGSSHAK